jgi:hypothetical protein
MVEATGANGAAEQPPEQQAGSDVPRPTNPGVDPQHIKRAWEFFDSIGRAKFHVAPMVDQVRRPGASARVQRLPARLARSAGATHI